MNQGTNTSRANSNTTGLSGLFSAFRQDFLASVVVFLVALPLCMGIAIASGVPVAAGLITGIVGGLVVGSLAGAPLQVSGPAAGLTVIVFDLVQNHGLEVLGIAVLIGGALQFLAGLLGYGRWFRAVSPAVIHGMLAGIGILIFSSQFHVMVDDAPKGSGIVNLLSIPEAIRKGLPLPEMGTTEERSAKRDLIQQLGSLQEEQVQQRELVAELIPPKTESVTASSEASPKTLPIRDKAKVERLAERQQAFSNRLTALLEQLDAKGITETVRDPERLTAASQQVLEQSEKAVDTLQNGKAEQIHECQAAIQRGLEETLDELKNHDWAAKVGLLTILTLVLWKTIVPARLKMIPAPLVAVAIATLATAALKLPVLYVEVPDNLWSAVHFPSSAVLQSISFGVVLQAGIVLAVVASAETLLCATAVDQMQSGTRTNYNKELVAQGVGNMICGFLGALPMTGVIVRSTANIEAGAKTRLSSILHGLWLLLFVSVLAFMLRMIPTAALAAMLVYIGYKLVNFQSIQQLRKYGWGEVIIYAVTVGTIVCTDLLTGVLTGIALSAVKLLHTFSHLAVDVDIDHENRKAVLSLEGAATFFRLPVLAEALEEVPENVELHVDFEHLDYVDHACLDLLMNWEKQHGATGGSLVIDWDTLHARFRQENGTQGAGRKRLATQRAG